MCWVLESWRLPSNVVSSNRLRLAPSYITVKNPAPWALLVLATKRVRQTSTRRLAPSIPRAPAFPPFPGFAPVPVAWLPMNSESTTVTRRLPREYTAPPLLPRLFRKRQLPIRTWSIPVA